MPEGESCLAFPRAIAYPILPQIGIPDPGTFIANLLGGFVAPKLTHLFYKLCFFQ